MAYYILQNGFELCGWKGLPFALRYPNPRFADFFDREDYRLVYRLDGKHDIEAESLTDSQKKLLEKLIERGIAVPGDGTRTLAPSQAYKSYPAMYKNSVQWSITGRCNYNCRHCFMSAPDYRGEDLTMEQILGVRDGHYIGGRLENYTDAPDKQAGPVSAELDRMETVIDALAGAEPFALIPALMKTKKIKTKRRKNIMAKAFETNEKKVLSSEELDTVSGGAGKAGETVIAYYEDGNTEILISQGDGTTFTTRKGAVYYLGEDGVYRSKEYVDLYAKRPVK